MSGPQIVVRGLGRLPAGEIWALGRNYAEHAREMGATTDPVVFLKPRTALASSGATIPWPEGARDVHHEVELVALLGDVGNGTRLDAEAGRRAIRAYAIGLDLTARDLQAAAKRAGSPWTRAKGFPGSAPVSEFVAAGEVAAPFDTIDLEGRVDGVLRQQDVAGSMIRDPGTVVALLSRWFRLSPGDLVFTGTPSGVGTVPPGGLVRASSAVLGVDVEVRLGAPGDPPRGA